MIFPIETPPNTLFPFIVIIIYKFSLNPIYKFSLKNASNSANALSSSSPSTVIVTSSPVFTPSPITPKILFASAVLSPFVILTDDVYPAACFTRIPAGLACIPSGSVTTYLNSFILLVLLNDFIVLLLYFLQYITYSLIFQSFCHTFINHPLTFAVNHAKLSRY